MSLVKIQNNPNKSIKLEYIFGKMNYDRVHVGDLVSWDDISMKRHRRQGLVLKKWVKLIYEDKYPRKVAMLKIAEMGSDAILNILAINVKIESQNTTY